MSAGKRDPRPDDPLEDLRRLPRAELERRAHEHVDGLREELGCLKNYVGQSFRPTVIARKHPLVAAGMGAALGYWFLRKLLRKRRSPVKEVRAPDKPVSPKHEFRRSFLSSLARVAGSALPAVLVWGIRRHAGGGRSRKRSS